MTIIIILHRYLKPDPDNNAKPQIGGPSHKLVFNTHFLCVCYFTKHSQLAVHTWVFSPTGSGLRQHVQARLVAHISSSISKRHRGARAVFEPGV